MKFDKLCTVITAKLYTEPIKSNAAISLPISIYKYQRPEWGFDFGHFRGARGAKIKKLIEKSQSSPTN